MVHHLFLHVLVLNNRHEILVVEKGNEKKQKAHHEVSLVDPLDIMTNLDKITPYFQAIFSADEQSVIGYEILGRIMTEKGIQSLGPFFLDSSIPEEYRQEVDNIVLTKGIEFLRKNTDDELIFINRDVNSLLVDKDDHFLQLLFSFEEKGVALHRFVLEITEHNLTEDIEKLDHLLTYYRTYGIRVAIDNNGKESSNLDRIGLISPDILKIDLQILRRTNSMQSYNDVLFSISILARKIGATLLYEDIEADFQLQYAWKNGGRYYQGFYLHEPSDSTIPKDLLKERLKKEFQRFIAHEKKKLENLYQLSDYLQQRIQNHMAKQKKTSDLNMLLTTFAAELSDCSFRMYICDENGFQQSANIVKKQNTWSLFPEYYLKNWSFRPYFLENIMKMKYLKKGFLSDLYSDIETGDTIRTFSFPLDANLYLFVDLSYTYLFEQNGLL